MRQPLLVALLAFLPLCAQADWVPVATEQGRRVEIDPSTFKKDATGHVVVQGRIDFDREIADTRSNASYKSIEALTRYDCSMRSYATLKRSWHKADGQLLREEEEKNAIELPVRSGSFDDKILREVCRPGGISLKPAAGKPDAAGTVEKANAAAGDLRKANEALLARELKKGAGKAAEAPSAKTPAPIAKAQASADKAEAPAAKAEASTPAPVHRARVAHARPLRRIEPAPDMPSVASAVAPMPAHEHGPWGYEGDAGPDYWGQLQPDFGACANGRRQSPIDIRDGIRVDQPPIEFAYRPSQFRSVDNGHTLQVAVGGSSITLLGKTYELVQFHFHHPAEERVNGRGFEMAAHLVHKADDGQIAVVTVLFEKGPENPLIQTLWDYLPLEKNQDVTPPGVSIDPAGLLPADHGYYAYMGSLTTPPCTEGVLWLVLKQPVPISDEQIAIFSRLYRNNARPIQPTFGRLIKESR